MGSPDVVVIGGSIAGLAAAARLAKAKHRVLLVEAADRLGGRWAATALPGPDGPVPVDELSPVLDFPAPWRDLFRTTGRTLEAELERVGAALVPAPPATFALPDGPAGSPVQIVLPTDRAGRHDALTDAYGADVADRWQRFVDGLADPWQRLRPLGLEAELAGTGRLRRALRQRMDGPTVAELADRLRHPGLAALVRLTAQVLGSDPARTPGWVATSLYVERTFGRWTLGRSSLLVDLLTDRLALRGVTVRTGSTVAAITTAGGRATGVTLADGEPVPARAVVAALDPTATARLLGGSLRAERRLQRRRRPALAPRRTVTIVPVPSDPSTPGPAEHTDLTGPAPTRRWERSFSGGRVVTVHDHRQPHPEPGSGLAWDGTGRWLDRPAVRSEVVGLFWAGPQGRGGGSPWATVLAGALASYAAHDHVRATLAVPADEGSPTV